MGYEADFYILVGVICLSYLAELYSTGYRYLVIGGLHLKMSTSHQKVAIAISIWFLNSESWVIGLFHLGDVRVRVKRLEWLRIKYIPLVKMWKNLSVGEFEKKKKKWKIGKEKKQKCGL